MEPSGPVDSTRDRWHVVRNRGVLIKFVDKNAALLEDLANNLKVLFVDLKKSNLLLLELVLNNFTG